MIAASSRTNVSAPGTLVFTLKKCSRNILEFIDWWDVLPHADSSALVVVARVEALKSGFCTAIAQLARRPASS